MRKTVVGLHLMIERVTVISEKYISCIVKARNSYDTGKLMEESKVITPFIKVRFKL